jgi:hypothetical protein
MPATGGSQIVRHATAVGPATEAAEGRRGRQLMQRQAQIWGSPPGTSKALECPMGSVHAVQCPCWQEPAAIRTCVRVPHVPFCLAVTRPPQAAASLPARS